MCLHAGNPVEVILGLDNYTRVQVVGRTAVTLNCSYFRNTFIDDNNISNLTSVTVQWWLSRQQPDFMTFHNAVPVDDNDRIMLKSLRGLIALHKLHTIISSVEFQAYSMMFSRLLTVYYRQYHMLVQLVNTPVRSCVII